MKQFSLMSSTVCVVFCLFVTILPLGNLASAHSGGTNQ